MKLPFLSILFAGILSVLPITAEAAHNHRIHSHHSAHHIQTVDPDNFSQKGIASWYGGKLIGKKTASGELLSSTKFTVAHKFLPFGTLVKVTNLRNGKTVKAKVNDRGPFVKHRIVDLSKASAKAIGMKGTDMVKVETVEVAQYGEKKKPSKHR